MEEETESRFLNPNYFPVSKPVDQKGPEENLRRTWGRPGEDLSLGVLGHWRMGGLKKGLNRVSGADFRSCFPEPNRISRTINPGEEKEKED